MQKITIKMTEEEGRKALNELHTLVIELVEEASKARHREVESAQMARCQGNVNIS